MEASQQPIGINQQYEGIVNMLTEIKTCQKELESINSKLLKATENTCSEYGDRILENKQSKLFYLQGVLRENTKTLRKHEEVLKQVINGSLLKSKKELQEYFEYCQRTATFIRLKLAKYKAETQGSILPY